MLTNLQKSHFDDKGYIVLDWIISDESIDEILFDLKGKYRYDSPHYNLNNRIEGAFQFSSAVKKLAVDDRILTVLSELLGGTFFPFQTLNFEKGTQQRMHSDWYHFAPSNNKGLAGVWVAFEDTDESNGALIVVPGSHKFPYKYPSDFSIPIGTEENPYLYYKDYEDAIEQIVESSGKKPELVKLRKGQILIWHSNLIHGGSKILDHSKTRYSQVTHYFEKGKLYFSPIKSKKNILQKSYRMPFNIITGKRVYRF
jgi:ectoine hydroxylase-related dioxygenase (phytanoyl-CoA dioxygenase family)